MKTNIHSNSGPLSRALSTSILTAVAMALLIVPASVRAQTFYVTANDVGGSPNGYVDKVSNTGVVSLFATLPTGSDPYGLAFDGSSNLYVTSAATGQIMTVRLPSTTPRPSRW